MGFWEGARGIEAGGREVREFCETRTHRFDGFCCEVDSFLSALRRIEDDFKHDAEWLRAYQTIVFIFEGKEIWNVDLGCSWF